MGSRKSGSGGECCFQKCNSYHRRIERRYKPLPPIKLHLFPEVAVLIDVEIIENKSKDDVRIILDEERYDCRAAAWFNRELTNLELGSL